MSDTEALGNGGNAATNKRKGEEDIDTVLPRRESQGAEKRPKSDEDEFDEMKERNGGSTADIPLNCKDCGNEFAFTAGEQEFYREKGFTNQPIRCPDCRKAKKQGRDGERSGGRGFGGGYGGRSGGSGCFNCGEEGHRSFECTAPKREGGGGRSQACYNCGQEGHRSFECTEARQSGGGGGGDRGGRSQACYNCGQEGHRSFECTEARQSGGGGGGRSYGRRDENGYGGDRGSYGGRREGGGGGGGGGQVCYGFQQGNCRFGDSCRYSHSAA